MFEHELKAAGLRGGELYTAYRSCGRYLARRNAAAFPVARFLLPAGKRPYYDAMLAFAGYADQILDDADSPPAERAARFDAFEGDFFRRFAEGAVGRPLSAAERESEGWQISTAFLHFALTWGVTEESIRGFTDGLRSDLYVTEYPTFADLLGYMQGVSGEAGLWVNTLLEPRSDDAVRPAVSLGYGVYLLDFLSDIGEDLSLGRVYLPGEHLKLFDLDRAHLEEAASRRRMTEQLRELVRYECRMISRYFDEAEEWWPLVHPSCRELPRQYLRLGRFALRRLVQADYDVFRPRPRPWEPDALRALGSTGLSYLRARRDQRRHRR